MTLEPDREPPGAPGAGDARAGDAGARSVGPSELDAFSRAVAPLVGCTDLATCLPGALDALCAAIGVDGAQLLSVTPVAEGLPAVLPIAQSASAPLAVGGADWPADLAEWWPRLQQGWTVEAGEHAARRYLAERGVGAAAAVPVFARGDIWAVLLLLNRTEPPIGEPALRIARMWAQLIGQIGRGAAGHAADIENLLRLTGAQVIVYEERSLGILQATPALVRALGYGTAELDELRLDDIAPELEPASIAGLIAPLHDGRRDRVVVETIHRRADGSELPVELHVFHLLHGDRHLLLCIANDISERRRLEERLAQAQRLEAVGRLAGGLAHDIAGLLGSVGRAIAGLRDELGGQRAAEIVVIEQALDRAHEISRQLLGLARRQQASVPIAPAAAIAGMLDLLRRLNEAVTIELHVDPAARDAHVLVDQLQFERALINLVANAAHASPAGGRVDVAVAPAAEGGWLDVSVVDRGTGMDADTLRRAAEPFFTSRADEAGTGLGLVVVTAVAAAAGGRLELASTPGKGTTARLVLPLSEQRDHGAARATATTTVLIVDDHRPTLELMGRTLREHGYGVVQAPDHEAALLAAATIEQIDLLVADVTLPGLTGPTLASRLRVDRPALRVLYISGQSPPGMSPADFLAKPFRPEELIAAVERVMRAPVARGEPGT